MRDLRYRYYVTQQVTTRVWAPNEDGAMARSVKALLGPRWQQVWPLRLLPWSRRVVTSAGEFRIERGPGVR